MTLYAAGTGAPTQLAQGKTDDDGAFKLETGKPPADSVLYVIAKGRHGEGRGGQGAERGHRAANGAGHGVAENRHGE